jgi:wyosine [tRNA(Phe)-imidazoG37] synthetase (radical SAM superfamily)
VNDIAIAGDGEPTACPDLTEAIKCIIAQRHSHNLEGVQLLMLSNATLFHRPKVRLALQDFWSQEGVVWAKLDAGTEQWFQRVDGTNFPFSKILKNLLWAGQQQPLVLQCMFHRFGDIVPSEEEISAWSMRISDLLEQGANLSEIQVYTTARKPSQPDVQPLSAELLLYIGSHAQRVIDQHGSPCVVTVVP